ncbi:HNH endonuclease [Paenarthrobacter sp. NPDC057355]|uniref:HNH endonuclease n=1 Tax=Paenarthrobacter sp. NPDC057355 TaxID=3346105 RepID=UPI003635D2A0
MPRKMTLTCCLCNEPMWAGTTSKPHGEAAHNKCRREANVINNHGTTGYRQGCRCDECKHGQYIYLTQYAAKVKAEQGLHPNTLRRKKFKEEHGYWPEVSRSTWIAPKLRHKLYERDNWTCQLCGEPIDRGADRNANYAPSLDHIVPQSHTLFPDHDPSNLRTVHRLCNSKRGNTLDASGEAEQRTTRPASKADSKG